MSVHYKFKSALDYDTVTFDGLHISVGDLKAAISQQKRIGKTSDFDLQITNAQTKEVYVDDGTLIPKNTSLLVARVPLAQQPKKQWDSNNSQGVPVKDVSVNKGVADLSRMEGSEQDKINAMITQSTFDYDPSNYQKIRGQNQRGAVPSNYICFKCQNRGHWIKDCPVANSNDPIEIRRSSGIPRSFMVPVDGPKAPGAMMTPSGTFAVPAVDREAYLASESAVGPETLPNTPAAPEPTIPDELICSLCRDLLTDAVMIPCCGNSFCDECIRGALLESEDHECPDCREKEIAPTTLIPNRFLRNSVSSFRNQTGYSRRAPHRPSAPPAQQIDPPPAASASPKAPTNDAVEERGGRRDESDGSADDNVTVTVPPAHAQGPNPPRPRYEHRSRYGPPKSAKLEGPPTVPKDEQRSSTPTIDERRDPNIPPQGVYNRGPLPYIPGVPPPHYGAPPLYGRPLGRPYPDRFPHHDPYQPPPPGIKDSPNGRSEDPLEAFNRMIREKEMRAKRREEERRRVKSGSRSVSRSPRLARLSRSPRPLRGSRSPRPPRSSRSPRLPRGSPSPRPLRGSRSPRPLRDSRSPRPPRASRSPRSPRARPRSRGSSRLRYSRSRSLSRGRLRRSPWSPRRRRSRDRSVSLSRSPSPRRRIRSPLRYRSALRSPVGRSPLRSVVRTPLRSPLRSPPRSPLRGAGRSPPRQMSPHRFTGVYDELLSPPRRSEPSFGGRYGPRNNVGPTFPPLGAKPVPLMGLNLQPQPDVPPPGYRGRFDPSFDDIPPGVDPPVPGFEPPPFEKPPFGPPGTERERLPPSNYREPYRPPYVDGPGSYRDASVAPITSDVPPLHLDQPRYRDNFRGGPPYRDGGPLPYRDGQPYRDQGVGHREGNFRGGPPQFRESSYRGAPYRDGNYRDNVPPNFRESGLPFRPPSADPREQIPPFHDPNYREAFRDDTSREGRQGLRSNNSSRRAGSRREKDRSRERYPDAREMAERTERPRGGEKSRESRDDRVRDYDRTRDYDKDRHDRGSQEKKGRSRDFREKHRSESRGRSRDRENKRDRKEDRGRDKLSPEKSKDHKEKDKKVKDRKKKKREKEREIEKKKKRDKKDKKDKDSKKDDDEEQKEAELTEHDKVEEMQRLADKNENLQPSSDEKEDGTKLTDNVKVDLYGDETASVVDKKITESYVKSETGDNNQEVKELDTATKDEPFDGIELQPAADELAVDMEISSNNNKEVLAPLPELSKWEVEDENQEKSKEPGELTSPDDKSDSKKVTSEVIKRAEKAIFAKAINSLRPIEIKKISSDRVKLYGDEQPKPTLNNIQITVPVTELERKSLESSDKKSRNSKTPPPRISVKDRLGGKVENIEKGREPRVVHSTVERVKSRSKTPSIRRVTVEKERSRKSETRSVLSKDRRDMERRVKADIMKGENDQDKKKERAHGDRKYNDEKYSRTKTNDNSEFNSTNEKERKKSTLDEAHFEPDYDENVESETETKEESGKKREHSASPGPTPTKKPKIENETIKLDLTNVKKRPDTDSASSSSDDSSSSSSSDDRKRKKKKKRTKKKKRRAASDSESESDTSSDEHKKKKKKRKHKKKSSKKKKKSKHK